MRKHEKIKILELGSGIFPYTGKAGEEVIHMDRIKLPHIEVVHDLNKKLPFKSNSFDKIVSTSVLEHIKNVTFLIREIHRVLKKKGTAVIVVPHFSGSGAYADTTHEHFFSRESFDSFGDQHHRNYYFKIKFKILERKIIFGRLHRLLGLEFIFNRIPKIYEHFLTYLFPARSIRIILEKI